MATRDLPAAGTMDDDRSLLARLRAGDEEAYAALVRANGPRLLAVARRILGNDEDARDAVQDAFLAAFRHLPRFEGHARLSTWLHRIAVNASLMKLRTRRRKPEQQLEPLLPAFLDNGHHTERFASWQEPADVAIERAEIRNLVRTQIDRLPDTYRIVLLLRDIEGLSTDEAAAALGTTPNAVKIRLHRARQALRALLDPHFRGTRL